MRVVVVAALVMLVARSAHAELIAKEVIYNSFTRDGRTLPVKSTNVSGTYFWYVAGDRCVAKVKGAAGAEALDLDCSDHHYALAPESGDVRLFVDGSPDVYVTDGSLLKERFLATIADYRKRRK